MLRKLWYFNFILVNVVHKIYFPDINECIGLPCKNGATCNDLINLYTCTCQPGYTGYNCTHGLYDY
jgi:hypothetical protein